MKKALRCIAFLIVLFLVLNRTYGILSWKDTYGDYITSTQQLYSTKEELIDAVFLGSSHCYCSINPDILWGNYGISAFNMSISGQDKDTTYHTLVETLKTQSPKVVCVEAWGVTFEEHASQGNVYRNMLALELSKNSIELIQDYVDEEEQTDFFIRWPIVHTRYKELDKYDFVTYEYSEYGRSVPLQYQTGMTGVYPEKALNSTKKEELTEHNREWLEELYRLSLEEDFELIFFATPSNITEEGQLQMDAAKEFADERGIAFFDFNRMIGEGTFEIDYNKDFLDTYHLNAWGAEKLTNFFGRYFEENIYLEDHRGDDAYYQWDDSYTHYEQVKAKYELQQAITLEEYIEQLQKMNHLTYLVSFEGKYEESSLDLEAAALSLGLTKEQFEEGGTYICIDGEMKLALEKDSEEVFIYELNEFDAFKVQNMKLVDASATNLDNLMLNMESVGAVYNGITFAIYDNFKKEFIDKRGFF